MRMVIKAAVTSALVFLAWASPAQASSITVAGSTLGCFGTGCSTFTLSPTSGAPYQLTFTGTSFNVVTDSLGAATLSLGTFSRPNLNVGNPGPGPVDFTLQVTFTIPVGIGGSPSTFTAVINGQAASPYNINFNNTLQTFTYSNSSGSGSFQFGVNDLSVPNNTPTISLGGVIQNASFTPSGNSPTVAPVPEPGSLVLLGIGLTAVALRLRKSNGKA